jgi:hypothetical protein
MARRISVALLGVGAALIWPVPLGGALVMLTGALGLAVAMEDDLISEGLIPAQVARPADQGPGRLR